MARFARRGRGVLTPKQGEYLAFILEWLGERGLTVQTIPSDYEMRRVLSEAFDVCEESGQRMLEKLRAAGCFGNPTDGHVAEVHHKRTAVLAELEKHFAKLEDGSGDSTASYFLGRIREVL